MTSLRAVPTFWFTLAVNLLAAFIAVAAVSLTSSAAGLWFPVATLALGGAVGLGAAFNPQTRRFGWGCLSGTAASVVLFALLVVAFLVVYFVLGRRELS